MVPKMDDFAPDFHVDAWVLASDWLDQVEASDFAESSDWTEILRLKW